MRIAVTGGSGMLGSALATYLLAEGHSVVSIDRALPAHLASKQAIAYLAADVRNIGEMIGCLRDCDALIHLAAHRSPLHNPDSVVYSDNTLSSYNALSAAATLGINRVCMASSINAIGGAFSRAPHYEYFPLDEQHPTYAEDAYSLSKWVLEQQADAFARRHSAMHIASLRFHGIVDTLEPQSIITNTHHPQVIRHLWGYTLTAEACRACLLAITADFSGHEVFYIVGPHSVDTKPSHELAAQYYPETSIHGELAANTSFFDCSKAKRLLGWIHAP